MSTETATADDDPRAAMCEHCDWLIERDGDVWRTLDNDPGCDANKGGHSPVRCDRCGDPIEELAEDAWLCPACEQHNADRVAL